MKTSRIMVNNNLHITAMITTALLLLSLSGCATFQSPVSVSNEPQYVGNASLVKRPRLALVLSGGGLRGFAHIGVIKVLEANGIRPDLIVGSSAGAIVGALYASGMTARELELASERMDMSLASDVAMPSLGIPWLRGELGLVRGEKLQQFVNTEVKHRAIENFPIRFGAVATNLHSGKPITFNVGNAGLAARASSSVPGLFTPPLIRNHRYVDGQLTSPVPVAAARALGAQIVIAVDVIYPSSHAEMTTPFSVMFQALTIGAQHMKEAELKLADIVIRPAIEPVGQLVFADRADLIQLGAQATVNQLPQLRQVIADR